jgi:hypothetical protein
MSTNMGGNTGGVTCEICRTNLIRLVNGELTEVRERVDRHGVLRKLCKMCGIVEQLEAFVARKRLNAVGKVNGEMGISGSVRNVRKPYKSTGDVCEASCGNLLTRLGEMFGPADTIRLRGLGVAVETIVLVGTLTQGDGDGGNDGNA